MEKLFNPYDKECMKMAMLKHEETFREQVYELHRLYQIQKLLMKNIGSSSRKHGQDSDRRSFKIVPDQLMQTNMHERPRRFLDLDLPFEKHDPELKEGRNNNNNSITCEMDDDDETELELTLGLGPTSRSAASFSSSSSGSSHTKKRTAESSATRQLPMRNTNREDKLIGWQWGLDPGVGGEDQFRQDRRHSNPPWLLQALSLNTT